MSKRSMGKRSVTRIAVPYYGQLVRPYVGVEKIYFVADVNLHAPDPRQVALRVWNPDEVHDLPVWLRKKGVSGIICSDTALRCTYDFAAGGIWVIGGQKGEVAEILRCWMAGPIQDALYLTGPRAESAAGGGNTFYPVARPALAGI